MNPGQPLGEDERRRLLTDLYDDDPEVASKAWNEGSGNPDPLFYVDALKSKHASICRKALRRIASFGAVGRRPLFESELADPGSRVKLMGDDSLGWKGDPRPLFPTEGDPSQAILEFLHLPVETADLGPVLVEYLGHESPFVRVAAVSVIENRGHAAAVPALIPLLRDTSPLAVESCTGKMKTVASAVIETLGRLGSTEAVVPLAELLSDFSTAGEAAGAMAMIGGREANAILLETLMGAGDIQVRADVASALGDARGEGVVEGLREALETEHQRKVRDAITYALKQHDH